MKWTRLALLVTLAACGGDDGTTTPIDAAPEPDAELPPPCVNMTDELCGYTPEPLTPDEISLADQRALAERFVPGAVYTGTDVWAVSVDYMLADGAPLQVAEHDGRLNFSYDVDESVPPVDVAGQPSDLRTFDMSGLPVTATGSGRGLVYFVDMQGTNTGNNYDQETWKAAWRFRQGSDDPSTASFPPTTYAHLFWLEKDERLLAIQYYYYYPYDKFTNNHEGDWEHLNVVLRYSSSGDATLLMAQFSNHGHEIGVLADALYMIGDHLIVFVGGDSCLNYVTECWCGETSGASFPYPGTWEVGYEEEVAGTTARPGRPVLPEEFDVVLLPRVEDLDFTETPNLSWYGMPVIFGEPTVDANAAAAIATNNHRAPVGPGPDHDEFEHGIEESDLTLENSGPQPFDPPVGWTLTQEPPSSVFVTITNNNCTIP